MSSRDSVKKLLDQSSIFGKTCFLVCFGAIFTFFFLAFLFSGRLPESFLFACIPIFFTVVLFGIRLHYGRKVASLLKSKDTIFWEYDSTVWGNYCQELAMRSASEGPSTKKSLFFSLYLGAIPFLVVFLSSLVFEDIQIIPAFFLSLALGLITAVSAFFIFMGRSWMEKRRISSLPKYCRLAVLGKEGFCFRHWIIFFSKSSVSVLSASIDPRDGSESRLLLEVAIRNSDVTVRKSFEFPIPEGEESSARNLCNDWTELAE